MQILRAKCSSLYLCRWNALCTQTEFDPAFLSDFVSITPAVAMYTVCIQVTLRHPLHIPDTYYPFPSTIVWLTSYRHYSKLIFPDGQNICQHCWWNIGSNFKTHTPPPTHTHTQSHTDSAKPAEDSEVQRTCGWWCGVFYLGCQALTAPSRDRNQVLWHLAHGRLKRACQSDLCCCLIRYQA